VDTSPRGIVKPEHSPRKPIKTENKMLAEILKRNKSQLRKVEDIEKVIEA